MKQLLLFLVSAVLCTAVHAQFYNNNIFYVGSSGVLFVNGSYTNTAASDYQNNGTVYISGDISNSQASMAAGTGRTYFNGTAVQALLGSQPYRNLNINIDNPSGLILANRLAVGDGTGGLLTFTAGTITSGASTQDVYFYPGSAYTGFDSSHHVIGYVTKSGSTDFDFPIGTGVHPADVSLTGLSGAADFQVLYTGSGYGQYNTDGTLAAGGVFVGEWWSIAETAGTSTAAVTLKWDDARKSLNHSIPAALVVAHFTGGTWTSAGGTSNSPAGSGTGTVGPSNSLSSFSPFTFGSTVMPLPIVLSGFSVINQNCEAYLTWTTSIEQNAASFDILQSTDGASFTTVGNVKADDAPSTYHATIAQTTQQAFYRLRLNNLDGSSVYSGIDELTLTCLAGADHLAIYPNPVASGGIAQVSLTTAVDRGLSELQVFDGQGRRVYSAMVTVNSGLNQYTIPVSHLAQGIYSVMVAGTGWKSDVLLLSRE
jgi:Secretion system C-terminal sorting domain